MSYSNTNVSFLSGLGYLFCVYCNYVGNLKNSPKVLENLIDVVMGFFVTFVVLLGSACAVIEPIIKGISQKILALHHGNGL